MSGPWEKYQAAVPEVAPEAGPAPDAPAAALAPEGPWMKYRAPAEDVAPRADAPNVQDKHSRTLLQDFGRQLGLTVRAGVNGLVSLPAMVSDAVTGPVNAALDATAGQGNGPRIQSAAKSVDDLMTRAGVPQAENSRERIVQDAASAVAGAGSFVGAGKAIAGAGGSLAKAVGDGLAAGPGLQAVSAATGSGAASATREAGGGEGAQLAAGLVGGLAPGFAPAAAAGAVRGLVRGGEAGRQQMLRNIEAFDKASGTLPTIGQSTERRSIQAAESALSKFPGGAGVMAKKAQEQLDGMAAHVREITEELAPGASAVNAGEAITRGVNTFKNEFQETQRQLYAQLDTHIPASTRIESTRTQAALADLNEDIAGAPELSRWFKNARIQGIEGGLKSDTDSVEAVLSRPGMAEQTEQLRKQLTAQAAKTAAVNGERQRLGMTQSLTPVKTGEQIEAEVTDFLKSKVDNRLPYESIKKLRTLVGRELADNSLVADVPRSKWSALYGALSADLGDAAKKVGPKAEQAWGRANTFTRLGLERLDQLSTVLNRDAPEKIFTSAISGTAEGDTVIRRVMKSLPADERREVSAAVLQRLGRATAGQQNAEGNAFSGETFLTNLSKLSPAARETLFGRINTQALQEQVLSMADMAENIRKGSKVFANPSGTSQALTLRDGIAGAGVAALTGNVATAGGIAATMAGANAGARLLTSSKVVQELANPTVLPHGALAAGVQTAAGAADGFASSTNPSAPTDSPGTSFELNGLADPESLPSPAPQPETVDQPRQATIADIGTAKTVDEAIAAAAAVVGSSTGSRVDDVLANAPQAVPIERVSMRLQGDSREPLSTWFGRRGDGYSTPQEASLALRTRQKTDPTLMWRVEEMPNGRFRVAGYGVQGP